MKQAHIVILKSFDELKFNLGKKTLVDFLKGDLNSTIEKNNLDELNAYGSLYMLTQGQIFSLIDQLLKSNLLEIKVILGSFQVVSRTSFGLKEIYEKKHEFDMDKKSEEKQTDLSCAYYLKEDPVSTEDLKLFESFDFFLNSFNNEQKKAIISPNKNILCIAGAGSGKTTVLTKRIEFLVKFKSVKQSKILAITFTRKAKEEMVSRLNLLGISQVKVETFNSYCEKILKKYGESFYEKQVRVTTFKDKIKIIRDAITTKTINFESLAQDYFTTKQIKEKSTDDLFFNFVNDIFSIVDFYKNYEMQIQQFYLKEVNPTKKRIAKQIYDIVIYVNDQLKIRGLRDFSDQIIDSLELFNKFEELIPQYEHVLVDEFQDVNHVQIKLIQKLKTDNLFAVGDPRQAIYGWRGSQVKYILDFPKYFKDTQIISLKKNYRSGEKIVNLFNECISPMKLPNLQAGNIDLENEIFLIEQDNELLEQIFVVEAIKNSKNSKDEIFILARTNKVLEKFADILAQQSIPFSIKTEDDYKNQDLNKEQVTLATIHSIKGMEAKEVYIVGSNNNSFPNKVQDNFVFALVKEDANYNKEAEELRLFYVALSRAKEKLVISYTGTPSKFITSQMLELVENKPKNKSLFDYKSPESFSKNLDTNNSSVLKNMLKDWRSQISSQTGLPLYMIISNTSIDQLCQKMPMSKSELFDISGLGPAKIAKYGDEIIKIING